MSDSPPEHREPEPAKKKDGQTESVSRAEYIQMLELLVRGVID